MSLSFHRYHTHKGVEISPLIDSLMQIWLWFVTGMCKRDWVSVHVYHHAHSDREKDPHSPVQKGFWRIFFGGVYDYTQAKQSPPIQRIRKNIPVNSLERFMEKNMLLGPILLTGLLIILIGVKWGTLLALLNFSLSPLFAIGGVNALAHSLGYMNHKSGDNSRNIGFLFPLNFIICGELDHNNHHGQPKSCSFAHRWFEFDIGHVYLKILAFLKLAKINNVYSGQTLKEEMRLHIQNLLEKDFRFQKKLHDLAIELNTSYHELKVQLEAYLLGKKVKLQKPLKGLIKEMRRTLKVNWKLNLQY